MPLVGLEPTISAGERPRIHALDRAATGTGIYIYIYIMRIFIYIYVCVCVYIYIYIYILRIICGFVPEQHYLIGLYNDDVFSVR